MKQINPAIIELAYLENKMTASDWRKKCEGLEHQNKILLEANADGKLLVHELREQIADLRERLAAQKGSRQ